MLPDCYEATRMPTSWLGVRAMIRNHDVNLLAFTMICTLARVELPPNGTTPDTPATSADDVVDIHEVLHRYHAILTENYDTAYTAAVKETLIQGLNSLGGTADQVAESLLKSEITGTRAAMWACPIACYANLMVASRFSVALMSRVSIAEVEVFPPLHVRRFMGMFDQGGYPELAQ